MKKSVKTLFQPHIDDALVSVLDALQARNYRFVTVTPVTHHLVNQRPENAWSHSLQDIFGWNRPFMASTLDAELFELMQAANIARPLAQGWQSLLRVSSLNNTLFAHSAFPTDAEDAVFFGPDTYRFIRAMDHALPGLQHPIQRCVDIGTGPGTAAILLADRFPEAEVWGVDINPKALNLAASNAKAKGISNVHFEYSNLLNDIAGNFDLIVANPPYLVDPFERAYRHGNGPLGAQLALDIVDTALARLTPGGTLMLYTGVAMLDGQDPFLDAVEEKINKAGASYQYSEIDPDIFSEELLNTAYIEADRIAAVWLQVTRPM
ncbi:MAG TPA: class I SAM-dependent methyltransferase [Methylophilus sp.]|nr:class I SAM-dependent methyltransferase [Methylophilus sp.]